MTLCVRESVRLCHKCLRLPTGLIWVESNRIEEAVPRRHIGSRKKSLGSEVDNVPWGRVAKKGATMTQSAVAEEPVAKGSLKPVSAQRKKRKNTGGASISEHSIAALGSAISVGGAIDLIQRAPSLLPRALVELWPILTAVALWHVCHKQPIACYLSETRYCA